jgi:TolB protein
LSLVVVVCLIAGAALVAASPVSATFPGKNGKIAFVSDRSGNDEIYVMEPDGSGLTNITNNAASDRGPVWSPDGKHIAFVRTINKNDDIWVMNADGSGQKQLTSLPSAEFSPHFSPDGERIVFASNGGGPEEIFVMDADGTDQTRITFNAFRDFGPHFSPDGRTIVFTSQRAGGTDSEIFVMRQDGSNQTQLTPDGSDSFAPDYSPDGEKIVFSSARTGEPEVFVMDTDGSDQTNLTNNPANAEFAGHFSPDGERVVFGRRIGGKNEIFVMDADTSDQTNITNNSATDQGPDWQPLEVDGDVTVTKWVNGTPAPAATYEVKVVCDNGDDEFIKTLTFGETGGTQAFERESFGPLECEVTESNTGGATSVEITCANAKNAECGDEPGHFVLFDDPGDDKTKIEINVTNTFPVTAEPTFTG